MVCAESDVKSDGMLHGGLEMRLWFCVVYHHNIIFVFNTEKSHQHSCLRVCVPVQIATDVALIKQTRTASHGKDFMPESQHESPFLYLKNKQQNLAFLCVRLTSSSDLALPYKGHSSVVM